MTGPHSAAPSPESDAHVVSSLGVRVVDLGRDVPYEDALARQRAAVEDVIARRDSDGGGMTIFLLEHVPVITISKRRDAPDHLLATEAQLEQAGVVVARTDRGGDITYHGPGQLIAYPILDLNRLGLRLHGYMRFLEDVVIDTLDAFGLAGRRDACATGVWIDGYEIEEVADGQGRLRNDAAQPLCAAGFRGDRKICAMGVRVSRWVSMHGLALNVRPDLAHFQLIVPCGLTGRSVTSMAAELGRHAPDVPAVRDAILDAFARRLDEQVL